MLGIVVAMTGAGVIACEGKIPWHYKDDILRFKETTKDSTVIMGRKTWESLPEKYAPLPGRLNIVISSSTRNNVRPYNFENVIRFSSLSDSISFSKQHVDTGRNIWIIGGGQLYNEAIYRTDVDLLDITLVPDKIDISDAVCFPEVNEKFWKLARQEAKGVLVFNQYNRLT